MLKVIAQTEAKTINWLMLGQQSRDLLCGIDLASIPLGEAEMIDLLSAIARRDPAFLRAIVTADGTELMRSGYQRNVSAVIKAVRRVEGPTSVLLDQVLGCEWCDRALEGIILKAKGV